MRKHPLSVKLQGLLGKPQVAQYADLAFRLKTDKERAIILRLRKPSLFLRESKEILLAHQDLEDAGFRVNYHTGKMHDPGGHVLTMVKNGVVWQIPVMPPPKHTVLAATTIAPETTISESTNMQDVDRMHEVLCCAGTTTMLQYYKYYHGTGFGKASTAEVRKFRCPHQGAYGGRCEPQEAVSDRYNRCTCVCGTLGRRGRCLCVLCRSAVELRPVHGHRTMVYTPWISIRATKSVGRGRDPREREFRLLNRLRHWHLQ